MNIGGNGDQRRVMAPSATGGRKDRGDELALFREILRREKERNVSLLQPVSDEFELNNGIYPYPLYRIPPWKKGQAPDLLLPTEAEKNDYDWLKTPPATPLFPSLEMEANNPNLPLQREITILRPLRPSRFEGKGVELKPISRQKSPAPGSTSSPGTRDPIPTGKLPQMVQSKTGAERGRIRGPSATRGGKDVAQVQEREQRAVARGGTEQVGNLVVGSRMVEQVMKARRAAVPAVREEAGEGKGTTVRSKERGAQEPPGYHGRLQLTQGSHDVGTKHMGIRRKPANGNQKQNEGLPKSLVPKKTASSSASTPRSTPGLESKDDRVLLKKGTGRRRCAMC